MLPRYRFDDRKLILQPSLNDRAFRHRTGFEGAYSARLYQHVDMINPSTITTLLAGQSVTAVGSKQDLVWFRRPSIGRMPPHQDRCRVQV